MHKQHSESVNSNQVISTSLSLQYKSSIRHWSWQRRIIAVGIKLPSVNVNIAHVKTNSGSTCLYAHKWSQQALKVSHHKLGEIRYCQGIPKTVKSDERALLSVRPGPKSSFANSRAQSKVGRDWASVCTGLFPGLN